MLPDAGSFQAADLECAVPAVNYDEEAAQEAGYMAGFQDEAVRKGFMRKVLGIVATQLIVTMIFSIAFYYSEPLKVMACLCTPILSDATVVALPSCPCWPYTPQENCIACQERCFACGIILPSLGFS